MVKIKCSNCEELIESSVPECPACGSIEHLCALDFIADKFQIPKVIMKDGQEYHLFELICRIDGIMGNYVCMTNSKQERTNETIH